MNTFGRNFKVEIFGESHGGAIGVVVDGVKRYEIKFLFAE